MKTQSLGKSKLISTRLAYGNMRCVGTWNPADATPEVRARGVKAHVAAYEAGYTHFDSADIYCAGVCEEVLGQTMREVSGMRDRIIVATKCGIRFGGNPKPDSPGRYDFSADYIRACCDASLKRLGVETIDLYHLHRPDVLMNPAEIAPVFDDLHKSGKVKVFAVSNFMPTTLAALQKHVNVPIEVNQVEIHLGRLDPFVDGTLDQCIERTITPTAWSPLGGGWLGTGRDAPRNNPNNAKWTLLQQLLDKIAAEHETSRTVIALAWLMKHPSRIIPIVGSVKPENIKEAAKADDVELSREEWYQIYVAARGQNMP